MHAYDSLSVYILQFLHLQKKISCENISHFTVMILFFEFQSIKFLLVRN